MMLDKIYTVRENEIMTRHRLDPYPVPREKLPLYINEPWLIDKYKWQNSITDREPEQQSDNIRIYIPLDLNKKAILRRLDTIVAQYGEANESNETEFTMDVEMLVAQIEVYDQVWSVRHMPEQGNHSREAIDLVKEFVKHLEAVPDGCAECFPFEVIERLKEEFGLR